MSVSLSSYCKDNFTAIFQYSEVRDYHEMQDPSSRGYLSLKLRKAEHVYN